VLLCCYFCCNIHIQIWHDRILSIRHILDFEKVSDSEFVTSLTVLVHDRAVGNTCLAYSSKARSHCLVRAWWHTSFNQLHSQMPCVGFMSSRIDYCVSWLQGWVIAWVQLTTHLLTPRGWMAELAMLADIQWMVYPEERKGREFI